MAKVATLRHSQSLERYVPTTIFLPVGGRFPPYLRSLPPEGGVTEIPKHAILSLAQVTRKTRYYRLTARGVESEGTHVDEVVNTPPLKAEIPAGSTLERCPKSYRAFIAGIQLLSARGDCRAAQLTVFFSEPTVVDYLLVRHYT